MRLIAISGKRRSGKSSLGTILEVEYGYTPLSLAAPLKAMVRAQFGLTEEQTDGAFKEAPTQYKDAATDKFLTPRDILIRVGGLYRSIDPQFWVKKLFDQIKLREQAQLGTYVITDVRFKNEMEWVKKHGGITVRIERDEQFTGAPINDPSETELDDYGRFDVFIPAQSNVVMDDLYKSAERIHNYVSALSR